MPSSTSETHVGERLAARFGTTKLGVILIGRLFSPAERLLYRATGGRVTLTRRSPVLLLTTTGRRSGAPRTVPVFYLREEDRLVVCNVTPPAERPNPWTLNVRAEPRVSAQIGAETIDYMARESTPAETERYWPRLVKIWPAYERFLDEGGHRSIFVLESIER